MLMIGADVRFWPNSAVRISLAGCRTEKITNCLDRQLTTQSLPTYAQVLAAHMGLIELQASEVTMPTGSFKLQRDQRP